MTLLLIGLVSYIIFIPFLYVSMAICKRNYSGYSALTFWVSNLGERTSPNHKLFNISISAFGLLSFFFVTALRLLLPSILLSAVSLSFLYLTCLATFSAGLFPMDINARIHERIGQIIFLGVAGSALFTVYPIYVSPAIPDWVVALNFIFLFSLPLLAFSWRGSRSGGKSSSGVINRFVVGNRGLWEWISCFSAIGWDLVMAVVSLNILT